MITLFYDAVWTAVGAIPYGKVASYGQIAALSGFPNHARAVGKALSQLPTDTTIPWYRVVNSQGRISFPVSSEKYLEQQGLLLAEGVEIKNGKISLRSTQWSL